MPPTYILPSVLITIEYTELSNPGTELKVTSTLPSEFNRIIFWYTEPLYNPKSPPTNILSSLWIAIVLTIELNPLPPILNVLSTVPSLLKRIM